jgi:hypothetical protein
VLVTEIEVLEEQKKGLSISYYPGIWETAPEDEPKVGYGAPQSILEGWNQAFWLSAI